MPFEIPMKDLPSFTMNITLDNLPFNLRFDFNSRGSFWTISFYDLDEVILAGGIILLLNYELISDYPDRGLPPGELWVFDITGNQERPNREDFSNERLNLVYYNEDEL